VGLRRDPTGGGQAEWPMEGLVLLNPLDKGDLGRETFEMFGN
jgi:hypothetical protein